MVQQLDVSDGAGELIPLRTPRIDLSQEALVDLEELKRLTGGGHDRALHFAILIATQCLRQALEICAGTLPDPGDEPQAGWIG
jgi:hypothetical protein